MNALLGPALFGGIALLTWRERSSPKKPTKQTYEIEKKHVALLNDMVRKYESIPSVSKAARVAVQYAISEPSVQDKIFSIQHKRCNTCGGKKDKEKVEGGRSVIKDLKRHARLAVAWSRHGSPVPRCTSEPDSLWLGQVEIELYGKMHAFLENMKATHKLKSTDKAMRCLLEFCQTDGDKELIFSDKNARCKNC